jgi:ribosomal protein L12E/L44/L45/RPP1/RPP2
MLGLAGALLSKDEKALGEELKKMLAAAPPAEKPAEKKKPAEEKPKEEKQEEEMAGLGALFG